MKTIRKYVAAAEAEGIRPGDGLVSDRAGWAARVAGWFPELVDAQARSRTWPELEGRRELITKMIETNTLATVHQRLRDEHGVAASESSLRRYVGQAFGGPPISLGDGAAARRAGRRGTDRLRLSGQLGGSGGWPAAAGAGVRDRAGLLPAHVRAAGAAHGCHLLGGRAHCGVGVLRWLCECRSLSRSIRAGSMGFPAAERRCAGRPAWFGRLRLLSRSRSRSATRWWTTIWCSSPRGAGRTRCWQRPMI